MTNLREEIENYIGSKPNIEGIHTDEILKLFESKIDEKIEIMDRIMSQNTKEENLILVSVIMMLKDLKQELWHYRQGEEEEDRSKEK